LTIVSSKLEDASVFLAQSIGIAALMGVLVFIESGKAFSRLTLVLLAFVLIPCGSVLAQVNTASVNGGVNDTGGGTVADAQVELLNKATGITRTTVTNAAGLYSFDYVSVGEYTIAVSKRGFKGQKVEGVKLVAAQSAEISLTLQLETVKETVVVEGSQPLLNTTTSEQTNTVSATQVDQLPVQKQDWTGLLNLGAGVSTVPPPTSPAGGAITINGLPPAGFNLTLDGTNATSDPELAAFAFYQGPNIINTINNDAIEEVSVVKGIAPATVGGTMSGNINLITKGGTNTFHGSVYEINDVSAYDARNQFLTEKPRSTFNQYGGSLGGPILKSKLFFFGSYEGARLSAFRSISDSVPTPYLVSISPAAYSPIFNAFPTVAQPANDPTAVSTQFFGVGALTQQDENAVVRADYSISANNMVSFRYTLGRPQKLNPNIIAIDSRQTTGSTDAYNASFTHSASHWTSFTRFGFNKIHLTREDLGFSSDLAQVKFAGFDSQGAEQFVKDGNFLTIEQGFAITRGHHSLEFGGIFQRQNAGRTDLNTVTMAYSTLDQFVNNQPNSVQITFDLAPFNLSTNQYGFYLQDNYKIRKNLTLNLGIRYDYFSVPQEDNGRVFNRGVDPANPELGPGFGPYRPADSMYNADYKNVQPRIGFSWATGKNQQTVVRGGFGIFVSPRPIFGGPIDEVQTSATEPFRITLNSQQALDAGLQYPLPRSEFDTVLANLQSEGVISSNFANAAIDANFPNPYSMQWTLGVQQAMPWKMVLDTSFVGNRGLKEHLVETANLPDRVTGIAPDPTFTEFRYSSAGDSSNYNGLQVSLNKQFDNGFLFGASYVFSKALSFVDADLLLQSSPQDNLNVKADYGPAPFDVQHVFALNALWTLPISKWTGWNSRGARLALDGWQVSGVLSARTGLPANILNGNSSYPADRPDAVSGVNQVFSNYRDTLQYLNPSAFLGVPISNASGAQIRPGDLGRDAVRQPGAWNLDFSLAKTLWFTERFRLQLRADAFNALNHTNLSGLVTNISSGSFGQLTAATARTMQLGARFTF
jgi:outer membrane receptor protein involved in Fe transport